jgi:hypothetical protein
VCETASHSQARCSTTANLVPTHPVGRPCEAVQRERTIRCWGAAAFGCSLVAVTGCSSATETQDAGAVLRQSADRTAGARSFELALGPGGKAATITYQAPDRFRVVQHGLGETAASGSVPSGPLQPSTITDIYIDATRYESTSQPDRFTKQSLAPDASSPSNILRYLRQLAGTSQITRTGGVYRFRITGLSPRPGAPAAPADGAATVAGAYLKMIRIQFEGTGPGAAMDGSFDKISRARTVDAPPAAQLAPSGP